MVLSDFMRLLREDGQSATSGNVQYAFLTGKLGEVEVDGAGNRIFTMRHVAAMREYLASPRRPGRKTPERMTSA